MGSTTTEIQGKPISIQGLTKRFGDATAVRDLSLEIGAGEMLVLLGPSGCGKTTTMRCVVGLEQADEGRIAIGGDVVFDARTDQDMPTSKRNVGMVFQSYAIWPHMSVFDNVAFPLRMKRFGKEETRRRVHETLELVGLEGFAERGASKLSGGQMQRVALARSIAMAPGVLLLDEPLSNLDAKLRDRLRFELRALQQRLGITGIYVTHDQSEALALADRIAVMRDGEIIQLDEPVSMYKRPNSTFVADFLGVSNLFPGKVVDATDGTVTVRLDEGGMELRSADGGSLGDQVTVCMRPEELVIDEVRGSVGDNVWPGVVEVSSFLGSQVIYEITLEGGPLVEVAAPGLTRPLPVQSRVDVRVPPKYVQLLTE